MNLLLHNSVKKDKYFEKVQGFCLDKKWGNHRKYQIAYNFNKKPLAHSLITQFSIQFREKILKNLGEDKGNVYPAIFRTYSGCHLRSAGAWSFYMFNIDMVEIGSPLSAKTIYKGSKILFEISSSPREIELDISSEDYFRIFPLNKNK